MVTKKKSALDILREKKSTSTPSDPNKTSTLADDPTPKPRDPLTAPAVMRDKQGNVSGVELPGGRTFLGINQAEAQQIVNANLKNKALPLGAIELKDVRAGERAKKRAEALTETLGLDELREQILNPQVDLRGRQEEVTKPTLGERLRTTNIFGEDVASRLPGEQASPELLDLQARTLELGDGFSTTISGELITQDKVKSGVRTSIDDQIETDSEIIRTGTREVSKNAATQVAKLTFSNIDRQLQNMEASMINHKESSAQVIQALQRGAYTPEQAAERLNNMQGDVDDVESMMLQLSILAPSVWGEAKGWEFETRLQKIRESILSSKQAVSNFAETGQILPDANDQLGVMLSQFQTQ